MVVSASGPGPGVEFGSGNSPSGTNGLLEAVRSGAETVVVRGAFVVTKPTNLGSNLEVRFDGAALTLGANGNIFQAGAPQHLRFTGSLTVDGGRGRGVSGFGFLINGGTDVVFDWTCQVAGFSNDPGRFLINCNPQGAVGGSGLVLKGRTVTADSTVIRTNDWSHVDISGVTTAPGGLTVPVPLAPVAVLSDGAAGPTTDVRVHDCDLDGGGRQKVSGLVRIFGSPGAGSIVGVDCADLRLRNTIPVPSNGLSDGLDINHCTDVAVARVTGDGVCDLVSCVASRAVVSDCVAERCNGVGILAGDGGSQTEDISEIVIRTCSATDCGQGLRYANAAGLGVAASRGTSTSGVTFENCTARDTTGRSQAYGFSVNAVGRIANVRLIGGSIAGFQGAVVNPARIGVVARGVDGVPDQG